MRIGLVWIKGDSLGERRLSFLVIFFLKVNRPQIEVGDAEILLALDGALEKRDGVIGLIILPGDIAEIGKGLRVIGIESQLAFELLTSLIVLLRFPIEISEAEVQIGLAGRNLFSGLEFGDGFGSLAQPVVALRPSGCGWERSRDAAATTDGTAPGHT